MPDFTFTSPEGKQYTVTGPEGATKEQAFGILQQQLAAQAAPPAAPAAPAAAPVPSIGSQLLDKAKDVAGTVARGVGAVGDVAHRAYQTLTGDEPTPYEDPTSLNNRFAAPFYHSPDSTPTIDKATRDALASIPGGQLVAAAGPVAHHAATAIANAISGSGPAGETFMQDVVPPASDIASGATTLEGAGRMVGVSPIGGAANVAGRTALGAGTLLATADPEAAVLSATRATEAQKATLAKIPILQQARQDGYKVSANDMRRIAPFADPSDIHAPSETNLETLGPIRNHNQALTTKGVTSEAGLANTNSVDPAQVTDAKAKAGAVYGQVGDSVGVGRTPNPTLDADIAKAGAQAASPDVRDTINKTVQFYRDHFQKNGINGPDDVQLVRTLRADATAGALAINDPEKVALSKTYRSIANAIEDELMRQLPVQAQDLKTAFPAARTQLAKLNELEAATENGQPQAAKYKLMRDNGAPLTGAAAAAANAADALPESTSSALVSPPTKASVGHYAVPRMLINAAGKIKSYIPGFNEATPAYQEAHYGPTGKPPPVAALPEPAPPYELQPPPGTPERAPPQQSELLPTPVTRLPEPGMGAAIGYQGPARARGPVSATRSAPSNYGRELVVPPEVPPPVPPPSIPESLRAGVGAASPGASSVRGGPSGYSDIATPPRTISEELALGSNTKTTPASSSVKSGPDTYAKMLTELTPAQRAAFDKAAADALKRISGGAY